MQLHNTVRNALLWKDDFNLTEGWRPEEFHNWKMQREQSFLIKKIMYKNNTTCMHTVRRIPFHRMQLSGFHFQLKNNHNPNITVTTLHMYFQYLYIPKQSTVHSCITAKFSWYIQQISFEEKHGRIQVLWHQNIHGIYFKTFITFIFNFKMRTSCD